MPRVLLAIVLLLLASLPAHAQTIKVRVDEPADAARSARSDAPGSEVDLSLAEVRAIARKTRAALQDVVLRGALDPAITGRNAAPVQALALEVGKDGETVGKVKLSWRLDELDSAVDLVLRGPINQSAGVPLTDRGLASGASATLGYNLTLWGSSVAANATSTARSQLSDTGGASLNSLEAVIATGLGLERRPRRSFVDPTLQRLNEPGPRSAFNRRDPRAIAFELRESGVARLHRTVSLRGSYGAGSTTFKFAELADPLLETSTTKSDQAMSFNLAYVQLLRDGDVEAPLVLLSGGYTRSRAWKGRPARQICTPLGVASALECRALVIGQPTKQTVDSIELDARAWAYAQKLGLNPHLSYDKLTKKWTSEVALSYLVLADTRSPNGLPKIDTKALTVGLRVGSRPEEDGGIYASIFFGTVLSR